jgi:hypothetical protein
MSQKDKLGKQLTEMINGLKTVPLPRATRSIVMGEVSYKVPTLMKMLEGFAALWAEAEQKALDFHAATRRRNDRSDAARDFLGELRHAVASLLGRTNHQLVHFGIPPKKERKKLTAEERVQANAKMRSTRKERHAPSNPKPGA